LAKYSQSPVINALSDKYHPLQALADVMTIQQTFPEFPRHNGRNLSVAWYINPSPDPDPDLNYGGWPFPRASCPWLGYCGCGSFQHILVGVTMATTAGWETATMSSIRCS
jgi:hypothetical protein